MCKERTLLKVDTIYFLAIYNVNMEIHSKVV